MGPRLKDVEDDRSVNAKYRNGQRFNGATSQGRGRPAERSSSGPRPASFNGATSQGRGRQATSRITGVTLNASMGPRLKDVEDQLRAYDSTLRERLQWGHVSRTWKTAVAVADHLRADSCFNGATSQGRGRQLASVRSKAAPVASMGPRLKDVEDCGAKLWRCIRIGLLQWGHVSRTWKTRRRRSTVCRPRGCFNGATSQGRGRRGDMAKRKTTAITLQWGHVSRTWKTIVQHSTISRWLSFNGATSQGRGRRANGGLPAEPLIASMGPRLKDVEDHVRSVNHYRILTLQWGHVSRTWKT